MTDFRKFCWGTFLGMSLCAVSLDHGWWHPVSHVDGSVAIIVAGLMLGCITVMSFGCEKRP